MMSTSKIEIRAATPDDYRSACAALSRKQKLAAVERINAERLADLESWDGSSTQRDTPSTSERCDES